MPNTYVALRTETVGTATATVTFDSIPQGYTDLVVVAQVLGNSSTNLKFRCNNDSGSNYSGTYIFGNGSSAGSGRVTNQTSALAYGSGITNGSFILQFMNYSNTTTNKTVLCRGDDASNQTNAWVDLYRSTSAITRIDLLGDAANFAVGSTFSLYGIANADQGAAKATGGIITEDSTYWYHTFGASGAFIPKQSLTCDVLVVAGGGAGGGSQGAGGGAGGLLGFTSQSVTATSYAITVGSGGPGVSASYNGAPGSNGNNSTFQGLTAAVGGGGGASSGNSANGVGSGGSGGGRANTSGAGTGTTNQGYAGGNTGVAGGGGAGAAGATGTNAAGGIGATYNTLVGGTAGPYSFINAMGIATGVGQLSGGNYYFAGGGGSGCSAVDNGGLGGGGTGTVPAAAGTPNTGGGGGGACGNPAAGGNGGSGVVIIRYSK